MMNTFCTLIRRSIPKIASAIELFDERPDNS